MPPTQFLGMGLGATRRAQPSVPVRARSAASLRECPNCSLLQTIPPLPVGGMARCPRCHAVLRRRRVDPLGRPLAMALTGLCLMLLASSLPFLDLDVHGIGRQTTLISGPLQLEQRGMAPLAVVVLATTLAAPVARLLALAWVLGGLRLQRPPRHLGSVFRWVEWLRPWSMVEVFLLGVFVAYTKLKDLAEVQVGPACYAMGMLMLVMAAVDATLDPEAVWDAVPPRGEARPPPALARDGARDGADRRPVGCMVCHQVTFGETACPRCGAALQRRKPHSITRAWALLLAAACLYVPANMLPVLTFVRLGHGEPSTILAGVEQLAEAQMWPLALLVFVASITVPVLKILSLGMMLITTQRRSGWRLRERTRLYRIIDFIGRWSMIDVFMISILTALVRLGAIASVYPGRGVLAFCAVVILTILATECFDPRLMWDAAEVPAGHAARA